MAVRRTLLLLLLSLAWVGSPSQAGEGLLATGGLTSVGGAAGGGIVPWAVLAGTGTEDEIGAAIFSTGVWVDDFELNAFGAAVTIANRVEFSAAHQRFEIGPLDTTLRQNIFGVKLRLAGDVVYADMPQLALGLQYKENHDFELPRAVGAAQDHGVDAYLAASKLFLDGPFGRSLLINGTLRGTRANETGLLGFGGDRSRSYRLLAEGSVALFVTRNLAVGYEYRQKRGSLGFADESDWQDWFVSWFPNKHVGVLVSYARLGDIAGFGRQDGLFFSLHGSF